MAAVTLSGCGPGYDDKGKMAPPEVSVVNVDTAPRTLTTELPGRTSPYAISVFRPQVGRIILSHLFEEGADAAYRQAAATVAADQASLETARINLGYTRITAPISGRVGTSSFTQGALVTTGQTNALTTVQTLDPIYVGITESTAELLKLRRGLGDGALTRNGPAFAGITLTLEDGSAYSLQGRPKLTDVTVDQTTGSVTLRAVQHLHFVELAHQDVRRLSFAEPARPLWMCHAFGRNNLL